MFDQAQVFAAGSVCMIADDCYSDLYKDVNGFRPRNWNVWPSVEAFDAEYARLCDELSDNENQRVADESAAYDRWIRGVHALAVKIGARVSDVIRWEFDAQELNPKSEDDCGMFCWQNGFNYSMTKLIRKTQGG